MSATVAQRPVPIRPSPARGLSSKSFVLHTSPSTLTPPRTGIKRKLEEGSPESAKCKRRINFATNYSVSPQQPAAVCRRNARERNRVKQVNNGFATLRQHIPGASKAKKVSKVETLKQAVDYIRTLQTLLDENDYVSQSSNTITTQIPQSNSISAYEYSSQNNMTQMPNKFHYNTFYYSNENVSPVCPSVYSSSHSPGCSDGATASPSPSYISDTSSQISSPVVIPGPIPDDPANFLLADTFGGTFGMQYLEDEDFIENCIESWEAK